MSAPLIQRWPFALERLACAYFFVAPALFYGVFSSRLPAIKASLDTDNAAIGTVLLALGASTVVGLMAATALVDRWGAKRALSLATPLLACAITLVCLALSIPQMIVCFIFCGLGVGFCDVAMNAVGIALERQRGILCLSFLHACSGIGGAVGALSGAICAWMQVSPLLNMLLMAVVFIAFLPKAIRHLPPDGANPTAAPLSWKGLAPIVWVCAVLGLICHVAEGSTGEWGSLLLHNVKGASAQESGLVFVVFTVALVVCRMRADHLRQHWSDRVLVGCGATVGAGGMALALLTPWPWLCLVGYALMGAGLAPVAPILFSVAGKAKGLSPGQASGIVSVFSYAGLLLLPPFLGMVAHAVGLAAALWVVVGCCGVIALGARAMPGTQQ